MGGGRWATVIDFLLPLLFFAFFTFTLSWALRRGNGLLTWVVSSCGSRLFKITMNLPSSIARVLLWLVWRSGMG